MRDIYTYHVYIRYRSPYINLTTDVVTTKHSVSNADQKKERKNRKTEQKRTGRKYLHNHDMLDATNQPTTPYCTGERGREGKGPSSTHDCFARPAGSVVRSV